MPTNIGGVGNYRTINVHCASSLSRNPKASSDWKRPKGRSSHTWLRAIEADLKPLNIDLSSAWKKAISWETWRSVVDTATLKKSMPREEDVYALRVGLPRFKAQRLRN